MFYISDEPFAAREDIEKQMIALCDAVHEGAPKMKIYCSTWRYVPQWVGKLDIWGVGAQGQASEDEIALLKKGGSEIITSTDGQFVLDNPYNALERIKKMAFIPNAGGRNAPMLLPNPEEYTKLRREIARHIERLNADKQGKIWRGDAPDNTGNSHA